MPYIVKVTLFGLLSGVLGTSAGGLLAQFVNGKNKRSMSFILEFSAGYMLSVVCFDLLAEVMKSGKAKLPLILVSFIAGIIITMLIQQKFKYNESSKEQNKSPMMGTGLTMLFSMGMHNLPEGLAIGAGFMASQTLGLSIMLAILLHDIPEGMAVSGPLTAGGVKPYKSLLFAAASGLPMGLGAFIGGAFGSVSEDVLIGCFALAAGAMMYVAMGDLIPESKGMYHGRFSVMGNIAGFLAGFIMTMLI